jgi:hypothetical protein
MTLMHIPGSDPGETRLTSLPALEQERSELGYGEAFGLDESGTSTQPEIIPPLGSRALSYDRAERRRAEIEWLRGRYEPSETLYHEAVNQLERVNPYEGDPDSLRREVQLIYWSLGMYATLADIKKGIPKEARVGHEKSQARDIDNEQLRADHQAWMAQFKAKLGRA